MAADIPATRAPSLGDLAQEGWPRTRVHSPVLVPYHFQQTDFTCGPTSLRMMLSALLDVDLSEHHLARRLGTTPDIGTRQRHLVEYLRSHGLDVRERHTTTVLDEIATSMIDGRIVLVLYHLADDPEPTDHYGVVVRIGPLGVLLHDPWHGPEVLWSLADFEAAWRTDGSVPGRFSRWMLAVKVPEPAAPPRVEPVA